MTESDGIEEAFEGIIRTAVMTGSQLGVQLARRREHQLQEQQLRDRHQAKLLADRLEAERKTALAGLNQVYRSEWWDHANPQRIGQTLATATAWSSEDPAAAQAEQRMRDEIQARYNIDGDTLLAQVRAQEQARAAERAARDAEPKFTVYDFVKEADSSRRISKEDALRLIENLPLDTDFDDRWNSHPKDYWIGKDFDVDQALVEKFPALFSEEQRAVFEAERDRRRRAEEVDATALLAAAVQGTTTAEMAGSEAGVEATAADQETAEEPLYDSTQRRTSDAQRLKADGVDPAVVEARLQADAGVGTRATKATATKGGRSSAPQARTNRGRGPRGSQLSRPGVER